MKMIKMDGGYSDVMKTHNKLIDFIFNIIKNFLAHKIYGATFPLI